MGRFTRDPELRMTQTNIETSRFSLAVQNDFVNKDGERTAEFINCVAFNKTATTINKYCKKGNQILVQGRIKNNSYETKEGTKRYVTDVVVEQMEFVGGNKSETNEKPASNTPPQATTLKMDDIELGPDDLPF